MNLAPAGEPSIHRHPSPRSQTTRRAEHRPVLIFKGGGYEGCLWEWNALFFEPGTRQLSKRQPAVTGRAGDRVLRAAKNGGLRAAVQAAKGEGWGRREDHWHLCTTGASWEEFDREFNKGFVRNVCKLAGRQVRCDRCQQWFDTDEIVHTGYRGDGGIGVQFDDNHCTGCADELHENYCAEHLWKYEAVADRVRAIQQHNEESVCTVSVFAARRSTAPVGYRFYAGEPDYY